MILYKVQSVPIDITRLRNIVNEASEEIVFVTDYFFNLDTDQSYRIFTNKEFKERHHLKTQHAITVGASPLFLQSPENIREPDHQIVADDRVLPDLVVSRINPETKVNETKVNETKVNDETNDSYIITIHSAGPYVDKIMSAYMYLYPNNFIHTLTEDQYRACLFFVMFDNVKSFLFMHGTGVGKTVESAFVSYSLLRVNINTRVLILVLNATLKQWNDTLDLFATSTEARRNITVLVYNTSVFYTELGNFFLTVKSDQRLVVIIDESHAFISRCTPKEGKMRNMEMVLNDLLDRIKPKGNKMLLLTGTPMSNSLKELEVYLKILRPNMMRSVNVTEVFKLTEITHKSNFVQLLNFSVSTINPPIYAAFESMPRIGDLPARDVIEMRINMSNSQEEAYHTAELIESGNIAKKLKVITRSVCNFCYRLVHRADLSEKEYFAQKRSALNDFKKIMEGNESDSFKISVMREASNKFYSITENISITKQKSIVYLDTYDNIEEFELYLKFFNITYIRFTGEDIRTRYGSLKAFNSIENLYGNVIQVMIISSAGSTGIDVLSVRAIYFGAMVWLDSIATQIIGRGIRHKSHNDLPIDQRQVNVYVYMSVCSNGFMTADEILYRNCRRKYNLLSQGNRILIDSSIELRLSDISTLEQDKALIDMKSKLEDFFARLHQGRLVLTAEDTVRVKQILYKLPEIEDLLKGYILEDIIYSEANIRIGSIYETRVEIVGDKMVYIILKPAST